MEKYLYVNNQFLPKVLKDEWLRVGMWDEENGIFVSEEVFQTFPPTLDGKIRVTGPDKMPAWADAPEPSHDELIATAEQLRSSLISSANAYMSERQWPGKAAIRRLKGDELAKYNLWLDYLDALYEVDTSEAPVIEWPDKPE
ncbi:tail fiber assembly protein [Cedecea neteri]|uniref:tail fiber assembly protein n=1 Tax=Cedecea neteri TaxID=158822 RepID=UPI002AA629DC|nr:tail fiber assembly protein [Cedecea neteri]WPU25011.1 tail fiber assembly protein [Cedecea neteri]